MLWRIEREKGQVFSPILHDVAGGGDGKIMGGVFDMGHVREWIYELEGAYFHRPTSLSLWSMSLLMGCSQDHFIFDALGEHRGDEIGRMVDELLGYCGMFSLTWISKHEKGDFHAA